MKEQAFTLEERKAVQDEISNFVNRRTASEQDLVDLTSKIFIFFQ